MSIIYTQLDGDRKCNIAAYSYFVNTFNNIFEVDYGSTPTAKVDIILNLYSSAHAAYFPNPATLQGGIIPASAVIFFYLFNSLYYKDLHTCIEHYANVCNCID